MAIATDENLTLELEYEHAAPPPLKTHLFINPQLSLTQSLRSVHLVVLFEGSG